MQASSVKLNHEMISALNNPVLSRTKKQRLRKENVKELIRSKHHGYKFLVRDLAYAAGYRENQYQSGYSFITNMIKKREIVKIQDPSNPRAMRNAYDVPGDGLDKRAIEPSTSKPEVHVDKASGESYSVMFILRKNSNDKSEILFSAQLEKVTVEKIQSLVEFALKDQK